DLQNVIERAVVLSSGSTLMLASDFDPPASIQTAPGKVSTGLSPQLNPAEPDSSQLSAGSAGSLEEVERRHIISILERANWMIEGEKGAAKCLNLNPSTLRSRMKKLGIKRS